MTWELTSLKKITTKIGSGATPRGGKNSYKTEGITLIRSLNVYDFEFSYEGLAFITEGQASETRLARVIVEPKDILLNITGASVARCCMVPEHLLPARVNQHVSLVRVDLTRADSYYVLYCINSPAYKHQLLTMAQGGTTREALTKEIIGNFEIPFPPLPIQLKIAAVLSAYDNLIENNTRRIKILEEMASTIYRQWFVEFRFPGHEKVKMVESELGLIPQGWEVKRLEEIAQLHRGRSYRSQNLVEDGEGLPFLNLKNIDREGGFRSDGLKWYDGKFQETQIAISNDIIMALTDMTQERRIVARSARVPNLGHEKYVLSMDLVKIKGIRNNKISQGCQAKEMSTNHFSRSGRREIFSSKASIAFLASFTPVWYVFVISLTVGGLPFHVIVRAKFSAVSMVSSKFPFQWFSKTPQHRSIGLYLL